MKTNMIQNIGAVLALAITLMLSSCSVVPVGGPPNGPRPGPGMYAQQYNRLPPGSPEDHRVQGARGFMTITGTEKLSPQDPTPEQYKSIISGGRFIRDADGVIALPVLSTIANGGVIGWSGSTFGFEPTVQEITGVNEKLTVSDVARACVKYRKLPSPNSQSGRLVRQRAEQIERERGYTLR